MTRSKKLQVFVSSTYTDLRAERQAAVEAILSAGHIPAGMELFAAGDQSQMTVIREWIDESDVFLLILGGRYGSIEPQSGKSYVELEYSHAVEKGKPLFAVFIEEAHLEARVKERGTSVIERERPQELAAFRKLVLTKLCKPWSDPRDIKLAVHETMLKFSERAELKGWGRSDELVDTPRLTNEITRLSAENYDLRAKLHAAKSDPSIYCGLKYEQMCALLLQERLDPAVHDLGTFEALKAVARAFGNAEPTLLHCFWHLRDCFSDRRPTGAVDSFVDIVRRLRILGLVQSELLGTGSSERCYAFTEDGRRLIVRLHYENRSPDVRALHFDPPQ